MIINHIKILVKSPSTPIIPALGNKVALEQSSKQQMEIFRILEHVYFWLTGLAVVPVYVLADSFIQIYLGAHYVLPHLILFLMCVDLYIHINQDSCLSFLTANGLFRKRRNISIGGAIINIVISLLLMKPLGIAGILAGTAVSQMYYWVARSVVALRECLNQSWKVVAQYWFKQLAFLCIVVAAIWLSGTITQPLFIGNHFLTFIIDGVVCEVCFTALAFVCCRGIEAERRLESILFGFVRKRLMG